MKKISRRNFIQGLGLAATATMLSACGATSSSTASSSTAESTATSSEATQTVSPDVINIGSTATLGSVNPLLIDATWMNMYAMTLMYNPLVALDENAEFQYMLCDDISTEDNTTYTLHINDAATWSDGTAITSEDIKYSMTMLASSLVGNVTMMLGALVGTDDATGYRPEGVDELEGVQIVDEKTVTFTFKNPINRTSFLTSYAMYIFPLPAHVIKDIPEENLSTDAWFTAPTVISGPYNVTEIDNSHYVTYVANENYWQGAPSIKNLNIKIVAPAQLLSGLTSGEIDVVPPLLGAINQTDYESVLALENVTAEYGDAFAVESLFFNCNTVPEVEIRQAMLYALDRQMIVDGLLGGEADIIDGFAVKAGPYYSDLTPIAYDEAKAKELVATATANGWDSTKTYEFYLNNGGETLVNASNILQAQWAAVGINVNLNIVDLDTLMTLCVEGGGDLYGVQYTYPPMDPAQVDISWVLDYWCFYDSAIVKDALATIWASGDAAVYKEQLAIIDKDVQENVPLISLYVNGPLGAVANRVQGVKNDMYGTLNDVHTWTIV